uniref:CSON011466 protein n=1 Tax=Culicoides sonorensis TaxID=179676 RepID=A0A336JW26_CULSO
MNNLQILSAEKNHIPKQMKIDENWFEGQLNDRKGIFPCSYVFLLSYNDEKLDEKFPHNFEILANKNHQTKELSNSYLYKVLYSYKPQNSDELELKEGEVVQVLETCDDGWFIGSCQNKFGTFPGNYVEKIYK